MNRRQGHYRAFTLIELLVVVAIIAVLVGILVPSLSQARARAKQTRSMSDLRQMMLGYVMYYQENDGNLLLGYPPAALLNGFYEPRIDRHILGTGAVAIEANLTAMRYPWRLVPFVANMWPILHSHESMPALPATSDTDAQVVDKAYDLSLFPTYGINATYVGGDSGVNGNGYVNNQPNRGRHAVFKAAEVRRPGELIVFAHSRYQDPSSPSSSGQKGTFRLSAPRANGLLWHAENGLAKADNNELPLGLPRGWFTSDVAVGFFDGHAESLKIDRLTDMRLWANNAESPTYDGILNP